MDASTYLRAVTATERDLANERILLSEQVRFIDAEESAGRRAHLANVRTVGELAAVVDDLPDLGDLRIRQASSAGPTTGAGAPAAPGADAAVAVWAPGSVPATRKARLPLTSPGREDAPPPDLPYGPYGDQFGMADPRVLSHRVVTRVVPTAWGPTWQTQVVRQTNRLAVISLICGILAPFTCGITGTVGVVTGHLARQQIKRSDLALAQGTVAAVGEQPQEGHGLALAGLIVSYVFVALGLSLLIAVIISAFQQS